MENKISFIPKKTIGQPEKRRAGSLGGFVLVSFFIFFLSGALWGVLLFYKSYLNGEVKKLSDSLQHQKSSFEMDTVNEVVDLSKKIKTINNLLGSHKAVSGVFDFLQDFTIKEVNYSDFSYTVGENGNLGLVIAGVAGSYKNLAVQAGIFEKNSLVKKSSFSGLSEDSKGGVKFSLKMDLDPSVVKYNPK